MNISEKTLENTEGTIKKDNPEKLATQGTRRKTQYVMNTTIRKHRFYVEIVTDITTQKIKR